MKKRINRRRRRGFTLMEILLVLAILVVLGSLVTVGYVRIQRNAMIDSAKTQIRMFEQAVGQYRLDVGKYPSGDQGLQSLRLQPPEMQGSLPVAGQSAGLPRGCMVCHSLLLSR